MEEMGNTAFDTRIARKRKRKSSQLQAKRALFFTGAGIIVLLVALLLFTVTDVFAYKDKICRGVIVGGQNIGGFTKQQAAEILTAGQQSILENSKATLKAQTASTTISATDVDTQIDVDASIEAAFSYGKSGSFFKKAGDMFMARFKKIHIQPVSKYDHLKLDALLEDFSAGTGGNLRQHEVVVGEKDIVIKPGHSGDGIDLQDARDAFGTALATGKEVVVDLPVKPATPAPINVDELYNSIYKEPKNSEYAKEGKSLKIIPHVVGRDFDKEEAKKLLTNITEDGPNIVLRMRETMPDVTTASLSAGLFKDVLGRQTSKYATSNVPRSANVELAAKFINGTVVLPGETFSYNDTVGQRTASRGFQNAAIYENNKMVDGMGGGICQVTSTLYGATLYADMETLERTCHSLEVSYVPLGTDATVVYGAIDFKFRNNTDRPIKVNASASRGNLSVELVGTKKNPNRTVKITTQEVGTTAITMKEVQDPSLPAGAKVVSNKGFAGHVVNTYKIVYENGVEVENKFLHKSIYNMSPGEVRVGTGPASAPASAATEQPVSPSQTPQANPTAEPSETPAAETPAPTPTKTPTAPPAATEPAATPTTPTNPSANPNPPPDSSAYPSGL